MKKIMFSDAYGLTQAVLDGRKTQTRRIAYISQHDADVLTGKIPTCPKQHIAACMSKARYKLGEVVAVAQRYSDFMEADKVLYRTVKEVDGYRRELASEQKGWNNKLFVCADLMPHRIRITDVRVERLNDISESDCLAEGVLHSDKYAMPYGIPDSKAPNGVDFYYSTPREAYAALIDKISGKGTWLRNPWVFAYTFELVK